MLLSLAHMSFCVHMTTMCKQLTTNEATDSFFDHFPDENMEPDGAVEEEATITGENTKKDHRSQQLSFKTRFRVFSIREAVILIVKKIQLFYISTKMYKNKQNNHSSHSYLLWANANMFHIFMQLHILFAGWCLNLTFFLYKLPFLLFSLQ